MRSVSNSGMWTGIMFQDITTLLLDPKAFRDAIDIFVDRYKDKEISVVAGNHFCIIRLNRHHLFTPMAGECIYH